MIEEYDNTVDKDLLNAIIQVISESDENDLILSTIKMSIIQITWILEFLSMILKKEHQ